MDKIIHNYPKTQNNDLFITTNLAYQIDTSNIIPYDNHYYQTYQNYKSSPIHTRLLNFRTNLVKNFSNTVLDIGVGSGIFLEQFNNSYGYDINPIAIEKLGNKFHDPYISFPDVNAITFWDSLEHIPEPTNLLDKIPTDTFTFISIPVFEDFNNIRSSKHYKPNEHLLYFSTNGLINYMQDANFDLISYSNEETIIGRKDIMTFVFIKN